MVEIRAFICCFSFLFITLTWQKNVCIISFEKFSVTPVWSFHFGIFKDFMILTKCYQKTVAFFFLVLYVFVTRAFYLCFLFLPLSVIKLLRESWSYFQCDTERICLPFLFNSKNKHLYLMLLWNLLVNSFFLSSFY